MLIGVKRDESGCLVPSFEGTPEEIKELNRSLRDRNKGTVESDAEEEFDKYAPENEEEYKKMLLCSIDCMDIDYGELGL